MDKAETEKLQAIDCYSAGATPETLAKQIGVQQKKLLSSTSTRTSLLTAKDRRRSLSKLLTNWTCACTLKTKCRNSQEKIAVYMGVPKEFIVSR